MHLKVGPDLVLHPANVILQAIRFQEGSKRESDPLMIISRKFQQTSVPQNHLHRLCLMVAQFGSITCENELVRCLTVNEHRRFSKQTQL